MLGATSGIPCSCVITSNKNIHEEQMILGLLEYKILYHCQLGAGKGVGGYRIWKRPKQSSQVPPTDQIQEFSF